MSNDNKTLADAQPGGRVNVWNGLGEGLPEDARVALTHVNAAANAARHAGDYKFANALVAARITLAKVIGAALSAQPSPGGQGEALTELTAKWRRESKERFGKNEFSVVAESLDVCAHELKSALAARQPVSESPMAKMAAALRGKAEAEKAAFDQRVQSGEWGPMPDQYDTRSFCAVCDGSGWKDASENELCPVCEGQGIGTPLAARQPVGEP